MLYCIYCPYNVILSRKCDHCVNNCTQNCLKEPAGSMFFFPTAVISLDLALIEKVAMVSYMS